MNQTALPAIFSRINRFYLALLFSAVFFTGCSSTTVKTADHVSINRVTTEIPESQLLDVGIAVFDTGLDTAPEDDDLLIFPEVRRAESRFMPYRLMEAIQNSSAWGAVRVVPNSDVYVDVLVEGQILQSDGEILILNIKAFDARKKVWFEKAYDRTASQYAYERRRIDQSDPFQGLYNQIANDLLEAKRKLQPAEVTQIRQIAEMRFAQSFSPEAFGNHLQLNKDETYTLTRLPAENDPMLQRVKRIRERDYIFVDTLQDYYINFVREMDKPYQEWRAQTYSEVVNMRKLERSARNRTIAGILAVVGGIAAAGSNSGAGNMAGYTGVLGGGYLVKSGFAKSDQAKIHVEALHELGDSLEAAIQPQVIELEDRTITLTGNVENQYEQWRELLRDIYQLDTGTGE